MKFRWKVLFSNIILVAIAFALSGYLLMDRSYQMNRSHEIQSSLEENQLIRTTVEAELVSSIIRNEYNSLSDLQQIGISVSESLEGIGGSFVIVGGNRTFYYNTTGSGQVQWEILEDLSPENKNYVFYESGEQWKIQTASVLTTNSQSVYIVSERDCSEIMTARDTMIRYYILLSAICMAVSGLAMFVISVFLTLPITHLKRTASVMASGQYHVRCNVQSDDEIGELGETFNRMAEAVENHVEELKEEAQRKEDFVANFTHEIKTPLTSIIGYADMIRSRNLSDETRILAANYIFSEGMRLETMSMKLFDLLLLNREKLEAVPINVREWFEEVRESVKPILAQSNMTVEIHAERVFIKADPDLLKTAFINMVDNSRKASEQGGKVCLNAYGQAGKVYLEVQDFGFGIPEEEIRKITQAFYMVDKSRSRESGDAGLGLALTERIISKNGGRLNILSKVGVGTTMQASFPEFIPGQWEPDEDDELDDMGDMDDVDDLDDAAAVNAYETAAHASSDSLEEEMD